MFTTLFNQFAGQPRIFDTVPGIAVVSPPVIPVLYKSKVIEQDHDSDVNAARNIRWQAILKLKAEGLSASASGGLRKTGILPAVAIKAGSPDN